MNRQYYTEREFGVRPAVVEEISGDLWTGLWTLIEIRIDNHSFGFRFPEPCPDGLGPCGCDRHAFFSMLKAMIPEMGCYGPRLPSTPPPAPVIMDLFEFCGSAVGKPVKDSYHSYFDHHHLSWDHEEGLADFVAAVNTLFARNGVVYELTEEGTARRKLPEPLADTLHQTSFETGDDEAGRLLETACKKILQPKDEDRTEALEKLWDAFERIKTLEPGAGKKAQARALLDRTAAPDSKFREMLEKEAKALTDIGNSFRIRHSEVTQEKLKSAKHADYLFWRLFAFIRLVLESRGRLGPSEGREAGRRILR